MIHQQNFLEIRRFIHTKKIRFLEHGIYLFRAAASNIVTYQFIFGDIYTIGHRPVTLLCKQLHSSAFFPTVKMNQLKEAEKKASLLVQESRKGKQCRMPYVPINLLISIK
jgi:hypothetical protein